MATKKTTAKKSKAKSPSKSKKTPAKKHTAAARKTKRMTAKRLLDKASRISAVHVNAAGRSQDAVSADIRAYLSPTAPVLLVQGSTVALYTMTKGGRVHMISAKVRGKSAKPKHVVSAPRKGKVANARQRTVHATPQKLKEQAQAARRRAKAREVGAERKRTVVDPERQRTVRVGSGIGARHEPAARTYHEEALYEAARVWKPEGGRLVQRVGGFRIYRVPEYNEYVVVPEHAIDDRAAYFTPDRQDAINSAAVQGQRLEASRSTAIGSGVVSAWLEGRSKRDGNTRTDGTTLWLYDSAIAEQDPDTGISVTIADHDTATTRSRLNEIPGVQVSHRRGQLYLNGAPWDGTWTTI